MILSESVNEDLSTEFTNTISELEIAIREDPVEAITVLRKLLQKAEADIRNPKKVRELLFKASLIANFLTP